jgi:dTDP-4-amino-4,6-dideoxygalactose transaminase
VWLIRFAELKTLSTRFLYTLVMWIAHRMGVQDKKLNDAIRVFGGPDEVKKFRRQPSYPMLALLERRLKRFDKGSIARRNAAARIVIEHLPPSLRRPGENAPVHNHWTFPLEVSDPVGLMKHLRTLGFDSINGYASFIIPGPPAGFEEFRAAEARSMMDSILYLPVHTGLSEKELIQLAEAVSDFENTLRETREAADRLASGSVPSATTEPEHAADVVE